MVPPQKDPSFYPVFCLILNVPVKVKTVIDGTSFNSASSFKNAGVKTGTLCSVRHSDKKYQSPLLNILLQIIFLKGARLVKNTNPGVCRASGVRHN